MSDAFKEEMESINTEVSYRLVQVECEYGAA